MFIKREVESASEREYDFQVMLSTAITNLKLVSEGKDTFDITGDVPEGFEMVGPHTDTFSLADQKAHWESIKRWCKDEIASLKISKTS